MRSSRDGGVEGGDIEEKWVVRWGRCVCSSIRSGDVGEFCEFRCFEMGLKRWRRV